MPTLKIHVAGNAAKHPPHCDSIHLNKYTTKESWLFVEDSSTKKKKKQLDMSDLLHVFPLSSSNGIQESSFVTTLYFIMMGINEK